MLLKAFGVRQGQPLADITALLASKKNKGRAGTVFMRLKEVTMEPRESRKPGEGRGLKDPTYTVTLEIASRTYDGEGMLADLADPQLLVDAFEILK